MSLFARTLTRIVVQNGMRRTLQTSVAVCHEHHFDKERGEIIVAF